VTAIITWSWMNSLLDFAETVVRTLWANDVAVFGYRVDFIDQDELGPDADHEVAILDVDALSRELAPIDGPELNPVEVWAHVDDRVWSLTGTGWRVVSVR
jgi:hypothetical protein